VEIFSVGSQRIVWGSDKYKPTCICVCVRFSVSVHTELVEGQISNVLLKRLSKKARSNTRCKKFVPFWMHDFR
jgi:hypothetical protein